jgi:NTP pyrophosphatase (non-canonical NTP hydrolase)
MSGSELIDDRNADALLADRAYSSLRYANLVRQKEWDSGNQISLTYRATELAGEVGEACNIIKKLERERLGIRGSRDTKEHLAEELADVVICADLIAMHEGIDLERAVVEKFNATSEKNSLGTRMCLPALSQVSANSANGNYKQALDKCVEALGPVVELAVKQASTYHDPNDEAACAFRLIANEIDAALSAAREAGGGK